MSKFLPGQTVGALDYEAGTRESNTITMPAVGGATQGDYVILYNAAGVSKAVYIDIDGDGTAPTGALYVGADSKTSVAYYNAVQESYTLTFANTAGTTQGDYVIIYNDAGTSYAVWFDIDAAGTEPNGAAYTATDNQIEVDITTGQTATQVATAFYNAVNGNVTDVSFTDGLDGTVDVQLDNAGDATDATASNEAEDGAGSITVGTITDGVTATTAIAGGALLAAITDLTDTTLTDNGDGTVTFAASDVGNATNAVPKDDDDAGAGSITVSATDGSVESFPYESPGDSPTARKVNPDSVS
jgi:hypothetical protein